MTEAQGLTRTPPAPRSLRTLKGARLELARLYVQTKRGEVDHTVAGKLAHMLGLMIATARDHDFDQRLEHLEAAIQRANGHDRRSELRP